MKIRTCVENVPHHRRARAVESAVHAFLQNKGYTQVDVPLISPALIPESHLEVFETEYRYGDHRTKLYLTPAQELFMKRLVAYGVGDCYTLGKVFRNSEQSSSLHAGEFTMLEYYRLKKGYLEIADEMRELLADVSEKITGGIRMQYQGISVDFSEWEKLTVADAFQQYAAIPPTALFDHDEFIKISSAKGYTVEGATYEDLFSQIYSQEIEPKLGMNGHPTLLIDFPKEFAATARLNPDGRTAQRFDVYIAGIEVGNCYSELTDPQEIEQRFQDQQAKRRAAGKIDYPIDKGFIEALQYGLIDCSGATIGVDRLSMIMANVQSIAELRLITIE